MQLTTERLFIRELSPYDWKDVQRIATDFAASKYAIYDMPMTTEENEIRKVTDIFAASHLFFAVFPKSSEEMMGYVCFHAEGEKYDLGYCFHSAYHGKGYAFESCTEIMKYFAEQKNVRTFTAGTAMENIPSRKLLEKLGFTLQGTQPLSFHKDEKGNDIVFTGGNFIKAYERENI